MSEHAEANAKGWLEEIRRMVRQVGEAEESGDPTKQDAARDEIEQSPLSVLVRDGWRFPNAKPSEDGPDEYEVLLSTGGPALRLTGKLGSYNEPDEWPRLQWQDWGEPWTDYPIGEERDDVLIYLNHFYFGD